MKSNLEIVADITLMTLLNKYVDYHRVSVEQIINAALVPGSKVNEDIRKLVSSLDKDILQLILQ